VREISGFARDFPVMTVSVSDMGKLEKVQVLVNVAIKPTLQMWKLMTKAFA
jgi:hypothetical protein